MDQNYTFVLGGGISGLIAALELEKKGEKVVIVERTPRLGGRVNTEIYENIPLDLGFQVLLDAYPMAQKYLDYKALNLRKFKPGAVIHNESGNQKIGDPVRDISSLFPTIFTNIGTLSDKLKILRLSNKLKRKSISKIFDSEEKSTLEYLRNYGFSEKIIYNFFRPFFSGIFLEKELVTSSRLFEFIFKMFTEGNATIPAGGMVEIPNQLASKLKTTIIKLSTEALVNKDGSVSLSDGQKISPKGIIKTYDDKKPSKGEWKKCDTLYFEVGSNNFNGAFIGLIPSETNLINSWHFLNNLLPSIDKNILSVTIVNENKLSEKDIIERVSQEVEQILKLDIKKFIAHYSIPFSLPKSEFIPSKIEQKVIMMGKTPLINAGDYLYYGSLNAAMESGAKASQNLISFYNSN